MEIILQWRERLQDTRRTLEFAKAAAPTVPVRVIVHQGSITQGDFGKGRRKATIFTLFIHSFPTREQTQAHSSVSVAS